MDKNLQKQQNLSKFAITIFVLHGINNKLETLQELVPLVIEQIKTGVTFGVIPIKKKQT
jgi:hypothetical protein